MPYKNPPQCSVADCVKLVKANTMCAAHHKKWKRWGDPLHPDMRGNYRTKFACDADGCGKLPVARGLCQVHYRDERIANDRKNGRTSGYTKHLNNGYTFVYVPGHPRSGTNGYVAEHRLVMEEFIGRYLEQHETVHHLNGQRSDNRISNLELWSSRQPQGQRVTDKIEYAKEILRAYAPHLLKEESDV